MALQIVKGGQHEKKLKVLVYGKPGVGKTRFACTAKKPLVFDAENGLGDFDFDRVEVKTVKQMLQKLDELIATKDKLPYDTLVIDSLTALRTNETIAKVKFQRDDRGQLKSDGTKLLAKLRDIDMHVICIAHEVVEELQKVTEDGNIYTDQFSYIPALQGSVRKETNAFFDVVAFLNKEFVKGEAVYGYDCEGKKNNVSKTRYLGINNDTGLDFQAWVKEVGAAEKKKGKAVKLPPVVSPAEQTWQELAQAAGFTNEASAEKIFKTITKKDGDTDIEGLKASMESSGKFGADELAAANLYIDSIVTYVGEQGQS